MIWIGTSGWVYPHWSGRFYPPDLHEHDWLPYYAQHFSIVEINRSFYRLPTYEQFHAWAEQTASYPDFNVFDNWPLAKFQTSVGISNDMLFSVQAYAKRFNELIPNGSLL